MTSTVEDNTKNWTGGRWTPKLHARFCPVSSYFLANFHRLVPQNEKPLNSTHAMLLIQILDHQWGKKQPFPSVQTLATRLGMTPRGVRLALARLVELGQVTKFPGPGGKNRYDLSGLYQQLEALMDKDKSSDERDEVAA